MRRQYYSCIQVSRIINNILPICSDKAIAAMVEDKCRKLFILIRDAAAKMSENMTGVERLPNLFLDSYLSILKDALSL